MNMTIKEVCLNFSDGDWIESKDQSDCGIRLIQTGNVGNGEFLDKSERAKYVSEETYSRLNCTEIFPGDILVSRLPDPIGRACIIPERSERMITAVDCTICRPDEDIILKEYLCYYMQSTAYYSRLMNSVTGTTRKRISRSNLGSVEVPVPDKSTQKSVVEKFDRLNTIIRARKEELAKLDKLIKARFVELFGDPDINPFGWKKYSLSELIENANNGMARRGHDEDGNIVLRLVELQDGYIDYSEPNRILLDDKEKKRYLLEDSDFLFARVNGNPENVGRCAVFHDIGEAVYHNDHIIRVHFNESLLNGTFASVLLNSAYGKKQLRNQIKTSAGQYTVSQDGIGAIETILPPLKKQESFESFVKQVDKSKSVVQKALDETQLLFDSLMQEYFA